MSARAKRRTVTVAVTLSVAPGVTKLMAVRELRSRINDLCGVYTHLDAPDVWVRKAR